MHLAALAAGLVLALVTPVTSTAAYIDSNGAVSAETQMNGGGCYPASLTGPPTEQLNLLNPEWAAIDVGAHLPPESDPVALHGTVVFAKINEGGDDPGDHDSDDQNTLIDVDAADMGLVAMGNELEIGKYPLFAWAGAGDRITTVGRRIWDCGHPQALSHAAGFVSRALGRASMRAVHAATAGGGVISISEKNSTKGV